MSGLSKSLLIGGVAPVTGSATPTRGRCPGLLASLPQLGVRRRGEESFYARSSVKRHGYSTPIGATPEL